MPEELINKLFPDLGTVPEVQLNVSGEPLMCPSFWRILDRLKEHGTGEQVVTVHSNGLLLDQEHTARLLDSPLNHISFSLDAATPRTFFRIRGVDEFDRLIEIIEAFISARNERGRHDMAVMLNMTLMRENIEELPSFVDLAAHLDADAVEFWHMDPVVGRGWTMERSGWRFDYDRQCLHHHAALSDAMVKEAVSRAASLGVTLKIDIDGLIYGEEA
jgi:MoaA/NifB/PqqE/SkfB family radical SAM enzyme